jgi:UDP-N-acetylglucosamine 2-epimerase (non-hydrolysing)
MSARPVVLVVIGTRPECIKMAPVVLELKRVAELTTCLCVTSQHRDMLKVMLQTFGITPDYDLDIMQPNQSLFALSARLFESFPRVFARCAPDFVMVHGDTTSAMVAALSASYAHIPVAHVEAGLRTHDLDSPFPEEINRLIIDRVSDLLFAPTRAAVGNLAREGVDDKRIHLTGNTIVDAVRLVREMRGADALPEHLRGTIKAERLILVTCHRRENFGTRFNSICAALKDIATVNADVRIIYPVHPNPNVQEAAYHQLSGIPQVFLTTPMEYPLFLHLMSRCLFVITDSGGVQEEACVLRKPVLLLREVTEWPEALEAGFVKIVGSDRECIGAEANKLLRDREHRESMSSGANPYGDGKAAVRIISILRTALGY